MDNKPAFISTFIEIYKNNPCLWKVKDESYSNKRVREIAYADLLTFYKKTIPSATIDTVKKKINNLRCSFRKELKKLQSSQNVGEELHSPSLWYFDLLMFSAHQRERTNNLSFPDDDQLDFNDGTIKEENYEMLDSSKPAFVHVPVQSPQSNSSESSMYKAIRSRSEAHKRRADASDEAFKATKGDEYDAIGMNVACKLRRMDEEQRALAELLINKVVLSGVRMKLTESSDIVLEDPRLYNIPQQSMGFKNDNIL